MTILEVAIEHYENFPVASWLCPPAIRQAVVAIYHFARTADDIADEGEAAAPQRLSDLQAYRLELQVTLRGHRHDDEPRDPRWQPLFTQLQHAHQRHRLPAKPLLDLLDAFEQDVRNPAYVDRHQLLDYCHRSANPVGRLLLHLQGVADERLIWMSDQICTALQLINFWQDLSVDLPRGRRYIPQSDAAAHGLHWPPLGPRLDAGFEGARARGLVADLCGWARKTMMAGADLPLEIGGRMGMELRLVVQGGLRVLEKIEQMDHQTFFHRPVLGRRDAMPVLWRALTMRTASKLAA